jgi:hypothetical protein
MALDNKESYIPLKPEVCWMLPLRREEATDERGHITTTVRQWDRKDWGAGGTDFHWWCTEAPEAFKGKVRVIDSMKEELIALVGKPAYRILLRHMDERATRPARTRLPHPAIRKRP